MTPSSAPSIKKRNVQHVEISVWAEVFLMRLLGQPMLYIHGRRNIKTWKNILQKLAESIDKTIERNIESDGLHVLRLKKFSKQFEKATTHKDYSQPEIILPLIGIIFELLGGTPNYRERPRMNRKYDYELSDLRSLQYKQTAFQKIETILEASRQKPFCDFHQYDDLFETYTDNFREKPDKFIQWYKDNYPKVYLLLF